MTTLQLYTMFMAIMTWSTLTLNNPMTLSMIIITMAICSSLILNLLLSSWYAMILYLIYIGGMMTMFSYFVSFSSNDSMWSKSKFQFILLPLIMVKNMNLQTLVPPNMNLQLMKLYLSSNMIIMMMIMMILLYMMIIVIKMVKSNNGPLRGYNVC